MNIALIGYGKMGKTIEKIAKDRGHNIVAIIDVDNQQDFDSEEFKKADVAIEFTIPKVCIENYQRCFDNNISVVSGTTGWTENFDKIRKQVENENQTFFWSSNFSLGVNIFMKINNQLAKIMNHFSDYDVEMTEVHHTQKLDAPSGTAITLAEGILNNLKRKKNWVKEQANTPTELPIKSIRKGTVAGIHTIKYENNIDTIEITHDAKGREGFALGAVIAAEFVKDKKGILGMNDLLKF